MTEQVKENPILILKLASGEEVLSEAITDDISFYLVKPVVIISYPDEQTQQMKLGLMPFLPYAKRDAIVVSRIGTHMAIPEDDMIRSYKEFTTGIALPEEKKIQLM